MFNTAILFLIFNRPGTTEKVFAKIREIKPKQLFIAADGPREENERDILNCKAAREIATKVDWDCEVRTLFREENLGCGRAVSEAITWFFDSVEEGIILEDDVLPDLSFFLYASELLSYYRNDFRIMMVSGHNGLPMQTKNSHESYFFSKIGAIWGWASWRRAWFKYDGSLKGWPEAKERNILKNVLTHPNAEEYRKLILEKVFRGEIDTWDYQWTFSRLTQSGLSILPKTNLVQNIGFGIDATHTKNIVKEFENQEIISLQFPLIHPKFIVPDENFDFLFFNRYVGFSGKGGNKLYKRVLKKILNYAKFIKRI